MAEMSLCSRAVGSRRSEPSGWVHAVDWSSANTAGKLKRGMKTFDDCLLDEPLMTVLTRCRQDNYMDRLA